MEKLYQIGKDYITKPLMGLALVAGISACDIFHEPNNTPPASPPEPVYQERSLNQFQEIEVGSMPGGHGYDNHGRRMADNIVMRLGDMDGDGDLDVVVIDLDGNMFIYENNIPQGNQ